MEGYRNLQEWKADVEKHQHDAQIGTISIDTALALIKKCPVGSANLTSAQICLQQAADHIRKHNDEMRKKANRMKLESFKREHVDDYE